MTYHSNKEPTHTSCLATASTGLGPWPNRDMAHDFSPILHMEESANASAAVAIRNAGRGSCSLTSSCRFVWRNQEKRLFRLRLPRTITLPSDRMSDLPPHLPAPRRNVAARPSLVSTRKLMFNDAVHSVPVLTSTPFLAESFENSNKNAALADP